MCMHDEAATHYIDMIDQTTLGHRFIKKEFDMTPRIGWQIDPFGHSAVQAYLLGAEIFSGAFPEAYEPPSGFYFEVNDDSPIVQDDITLFDYNVHDRVNDFVATAVSQANITRTNHIMWTMGTDFMYQYAHTWFRQMDKLIHYVNMDGRVNALYSTPSIYTDAKYATNESWPIKTGDFFPYADRANAYWTGYFTSRPALKHYVRTMSGYYLAARQLEFFIGRTDSGPNTDSLADALAIAQHHDAVTGTEKQHVANDYAKRLAIGYTEAEQVVATSLAHLVESASYTGSVNPTTKFQQCPLLNISYCPASEMNFSEAKQLIVMVYNSLGWKRDDVIRIPIINEDVTVHDSEGREIESQLLPLDDAHVGLRNYYAKAYLGQTPTKTPNYWLAFTVSVPPLGFNTYTISLLGKGAGSTRSSVQTFQSREESTIEVGQGNVKLTFSTNQGKMTKYVNRRSLVEELVEQSYGFYNGYNGSDDKAPLIPQNAGAYIFRPNGTFLIKPGEKASLTVVRGPVIDEVHQQINAWIYQVTRIHKEKEHVEFEFIVGPLPTDDGIGKEVVTQLATTMATNKTFYTDSNGRDFIERIRDYRTDWDLKVHQPIAGNYYPINLGIYMQDNSTEFSVLVDRSIGGSSTVDGQIELMLHRRLLLDDSRGVAEALNETVCIDNVCSGLRIQGKFYFRIDPLGEGAKWRRTFGQEIYSPLLLAFSEQDGDNWKNSHVTTFSGVGSSYSLPNNVALITLQELDDGKVLLRLAHLYEIGEDRDLSVMANVELKQLFPRKKIGKLTEMNLSANQERTGMEKKRLNWKVEEGSSSEAKVARGGTVDPAKLVVELAPMEIRTFLVEFNQSFNHYSFDA
ncbi:probable alpha-mannosidase At5g13980 isoform X2 [Malus domestica]|uniref:probable alpha-mannosidase At5g13980 isoform X2 n=1 Tax=Malus domestica TaxID=3750 RepID=UPI00397696BD